MKIKVILIALFIIFYSLFLLSFNKQKHYYQNQILGKSSYYSSNVTMSLSIGDHRFTLFGYSSPYALITFSGLGIFDQTQADENGYFIFNNRFSPFSPREACLHSQDQLGRITSEVCLPPFPTNYNVKIGPVIMPPTLSLDKENYWVGDEVVLTGQTIPNSSIILSFFSQPTPLSTINNLLAKFAPLKKAFALSLPPLSVKADEKGNFALGLPSSISQKYRLFTQVNYQEKNSPESRNLTFEVLPWWMIVFKILKLIISLIKLRLLEIIILGEIIALLIYLYRSYLHPQKLAIIKWEKKPLMKHNFKRTDLEKVGP